MSEAEKYLRELGLKYLAIRPRSEKELLDYLNKRALSRGITGSIVNSVWSTFKLSRLADDRSFSEWFIDARRGKAAKGDAFIRQELRRKGVKEDFINEIMVDSQHVVSEYERAKNFLQVNRKKWEKLSGRERDLRISRLLSYRGFSYATVSKLIDELAGNN